VGIKCKYDHGGNRWLKKQPAHKKERPIHTWIGVRVKIGEKPTTWIILPEAVSNEEVKKNGASAKRGAKTASKSLHGPPFARQMKPTHQSNKGTIMNNILSFSTVSKPLITVT
jgi:hypothetical protein